MRSPLSDRASALATIGVGHGAALGINIRKRRTACLAELARCTWPAPGASLDLDFVNNRGYAFGRGIAKATDLIEFTRGTTESYTNSAGVLATAAINEAVIDFDPVTLAGKGMAVWESRTNLLTYSQEFDNAAWLKNAITVSANATTAPDGTTTADKLVEANTSQYNYFYRNRTASNETVTVSFYVKQAGRKYFKIQFTDNVAYVAAAVFDLNAGTVFSTSATNIEYTAITSRIESVGSGWYRVSLTATKAAVHPDNVLSAFLVANDGSTVLYTGDGTSGVYIWQADLVVGAFPGPPIPTTSSQVTCSADVPVITGQNFSSWYRQDEGMFVVEYSRPKAIANSFVIEVSTNSFDEFIGIYTDGTPNQILGVRNDGAQSAAPTLLSGAGVDGTTYIVAVALKLDDFAASINGGTISTDTAGTMPTPNRMNIGSFGASSQFLNGHIKRLRFYPFHTRPQIQALATP